MMDFERLDSIAQMCREGDARMFGPLSSGEKRYVAVAANRADLLTQIGDTIPEAVRLLDQEHALQRLLQRWTW